MAGEAAQWLRDLPALPEDPGSVPGTHLAAHKLLGPEDPMPLPVSAGTRHTRPHGAQTNTHNHRIEIKSNGEGLATFLGLPSNSSIC